MKSKLFGGLVVVAALSACGPSEQVTPEPVVEAADTAQVEQGASSISGYGTTYVSGYDVFVAVENWQSPVPHTNHGFVMAHWIAPVTRSPNDWLAMAPVGSPLSTYVTWQHVGRAGSWKGVGDEFQIPTGTPTNVQYEIRYIMGDGTLAAISQPFNVKAIEHLPCASASEASGGNVPTAKWIELGATSGTVTFSFQPNWVADRVLVTSGSTVIYDSGCIDMPVTVSIPYTNSNSRLRVRTMPDCWSTREGTAWSWSMSCPQ